MIVSALPIERGSSGFAFLNGCSIERRNDQLRKALRCIVFEIDAETFRQVSGTGNMEPADVLRTQHSGVLAVVHLGISTRICEIPGKTVQLMAPIARSRFLSNCESPASLKGLQSKCRLENRCLARPYYRRKTPRSLFAES